MSRFAIATMSPEDASARSGVYRLLSRLWICELDLEWVQKLRAPPLCDSFSAAGGNLPTCDDEPTVEELAIDYCRLFIGPSGHLPPYQSVWQTGQFEGTAVASMQTFIDLVGYNREALPTGLSLDHLGVQLDLMSHILGHVANWQSGANQLEQVLELAGSFFASHLRWPAELFQAATDRAKTDFYRSTITLTRQFLESEPKA